MSKGYSTLTRCVALFLAVLLIAGCGMIQVSADQENDSSADLSMGVSVEGFEKVAETDRLMLYVNGDNGHIAVVDKADGFQWSSLPAGYESDEVATGRNKADLQSALHLKYYSSEQDSLSSANSYAGSVQKGGVSVAQLDDGCRIKFSFLAEQLSVMVDITLKNNVLSITVPLEGIQEDGTNLLMELTPYPFLGAADAQAEGFIFVPDGCGSLIHLNNGKTTVSAYSQMIYGRDMNIAQDQAPALREAILLPVFGMQQNGHGFLAIISEGEALGKINASVAGVKNSYNSVNSSYVIRTTDKYVIGKNSGGVQKSATIYQQAKPESGSIQQEYLILNQGESSIGGMAAACREYMAAKYQWNKQNKQSSTFYLSLVGATRRNQTFLGFPTVGTQPLTTFSQAQVLLSELCKQNVENIQVRYRQWSTSSLSGKPQVDAAPLSALGGRSGFSELIEYASGNGINVFPTYDPLEVSQWGNGYGRFFHSSQTLSGMAAFLHQYDLSTLQKDKSYNLLSYVFVPSASDKFLKKYAKLNNNALAIETLGTLLASDFSVKTSNRQTVCDTLEETVKKIAQKHDIMISGGAFYAAKYASNLVDLPATDSGFSITDQAVPFYQMVIHGYKSYTDSSINLMDESKDGFLRAVETGGGLHYTWMAEKASVLKDSEDQSLFSAYADDKKIATAVEQYMLLKELNNKTADAFICDYRHLASGVVLTEYDNGIRTIVNYTDADYVFEDVVVKAGNFVCL